MNRTSHLPAPHCHHTGAGFFGFLLLIALCAGCRSESDMLDEAAPTPTTEVPELDPENQPAMVYEADDLAAPGTALPANHPPIATETVTGSALAWVTPAGWVSQAPSHTMRLAQWALPGSDGDATCVLSATAGGTAVENVRRWLGQFEANDGVDPNMVAELADVVLAGYPTTLLRTHGTYMDPGVGMQGEITPRPDWAIFGAIVEIPDRMHFFKCTGPRSTIDAQSDALESFVRSFQPAGA